MNKKIHTFLVLGGYGEMGEITVHDLFETSQGNIIVAGRDFEAAEKFARSFTSTRVSGTEIDVRNIKKLAALMKNCDVVINCTQYTWNLHVMRACEIARKPYLDLGGLFHMTRRQLTLHNRFKKKKLLAIVGCGSTPGITNILAAHGTKLLDRVDEIAIRFADYDYAASRRRKEKHFTLPYSFATLVDEFTKKAAVLKNGKLKFVKAMTGKEIEKFPKPVGKVTEYYTLHSELVTFPSSFKKNGLKECSFKVSFSEDFIKQVKNFIKKGTTPPGPGTKEIPHDLEYLRVRMKGTQKGKKMLLILDCIAKSKRAWHAAAGSFNTGVPPSIIAQQIAERKIKQVGVFPPEKCVKPSLFFKELRKRGFTIKNVVTASLANYRGSA